MESISVSLTEGLKLHPLQQKIYGTELVDMELVESIRKLGVLSPLLIDGDNHILSGTRRWQAAREMGMNTVPTILFNGSELEASQLLIEANRQREKTVGPGPSAA